MKIVEQTPTQLVLQRQPGRLSWFTLVILWILGGFLLTTATAIAQVAAPSPTSPQSVSPQTELEQLREEKRIEALVKETLKDSSEIRVLVQDEVDRANSANTILLNFLLTLLTLTPIAAAIISFWMRRGVVYEAVSETRKLLQEEVEKQLSDEVRDSVVEQIVSETIRRLQQEEQQARQAVIEIKQQIEELQAKFTEQMMTLQLQTAEALNAQPIKEQLLQAIGRLTPSPAHEESVSIDIQQRIQQLTEELEKLQTSTPTLVLTASDYSKQGEAFYFEGRYQNALDSYREAIQLKADDPQTWINQAITLRKLEQFEDAIASHDKAIDLDPNYRRAWYTKAYTLRLCKRYEEAIACLDRAIELDPEAYRSWDNRGSVLKELGHYEEAIASYNKAIQIQPDYSKVWSHKARCYALWGKVNLAIDSWAKSIELDPVYRKLAVTEPDFQSIRDNQLFQNLILTANEE